MHVHIETTTQGYIINGILRTEADFHNAMQAQDAGGNGPNNDGWELDSCHLRAVVVLSDGTRVAIRPDNPDQFIRLPLNESWGWYCRFNQ